MSRHANLRLQSEPLMLSVIAWTQDEGKYKYSRGIVYNVTDEPEAIKVLAPDLWDCHVRVS